MSCGGAESSSLMTSTRSLRPDGAYLKVPGRMVPTCGLMEGMVMTAIILPPAAGSMNSMSPVSSLYTSTVASLVQPVSRRAAKWGAKSRPFTVAPTNTAEGRYFLQSSTYRFEYASVLYLS